MEIHEHLYKQYVSNYAAKTSKHAMAIVIESTPNTPNHSNSTSQDTDTSAWTVQTEAGMK